MHASIIMSTIILSAVVLVIGVVGKALYAWGMLMLLAFIFMLMLSVV
jgi:hypothetical protein